MYDGMPPIPAWIPTAKGYLPEWETFGAYSKICYESNRYVSAWELIPLKSGKPGKRTRQATRYWTPIMRCARCGIYRKRHHFGVERRWYRWDAMLAIFGAESPGYLVMCLGCDNTFRSFVRIWVKHDDMRIFINRQRKKLHEASKNSAGTDGSPVVHHGGSDQRRRKGVGSPDCVERGYSDHRSGSSRDAGPRFGVCDKADASPVTSVDRQHLAEV